MRTGFENMQLGTSLEHKYPILMKCIRLFCKLHTMSLRWMGSFVLSNFCLVCIAQYEWGDEIQPMRSHQPPTPTNEVPPTQWPGTQYCHRDTTWRVRGPPRSTCSVRPGTRRISPGKKHSPQWKLILRVSSPSIVHNRVSTFYEWVWEASFVKERIFGFFFSWILNLLAGISGYQYFLPNLTVYTRLWSPCGAHLVIFLEWPGIQISHLDATSRGRWATQSTRRVS